MSTDHAARWRLRAFAAGLLALLLLGAWQCRHGWPVALDLMALLPQGNVQDSGPDSAHSALRQRAQARIQAPLAHQVLALVGHTDAERAVQAAQQLAGRWQASGLFSQVTLSPELDLPRLRRRLLRQRLALLPAAERERLLRDPAAWARDRARARARALADPFASVAALPLSRDWLGLGAQAQAALQPDSRMRYDLASRTLQTTHAGHTWVLLRASTRATAFTARATPPRQGMAARVAADRAWLAAQGAGLLVAGGPLYADQARARVQREIAWTGSGASLGIALVLLLALRRARALLALVPIAAGLLAGAVACVAVFGSIHVLTLVVGASLIGVAVDFPLHWLGKSYGIHPWQAQPVLHRVRHGLRLSMAASLIGYLALAFTPFVALRQTAVFSVAGLLAAYACTVCVLPVCLRHWQPHPWPALLRAAQGLLAWRARAGGVGARAALLLAAAGLLAGITRLEVQDDMRQWLGLPDSLLAEARQIGELTGIMPTSQFFLVQAKDADELLHRQARLGQTLDALVARGVLDGWSAPGQQLAPTDTQRQLAARLAQLADAPQHWQALTDMGAPWPLLRAELLELSTLPPVPLSEALQDEGDDGPWRALWLGGPVGGPADGQVDRAAGLVTLGGLHDARALEAAARTMDMPGVTWMDRTGELNQLFAATRVQAAELKLLSWLAAAALLCWGLGRAAVLPILAVPILAVAASLAALGWLGLPLTLFGVFGLLLVSALGVDYAIFMYEGVGGAAASLVGIGLGAATTLLSFGLLAWSQTPAIANFGQTVALGIVFCAGLALWVRNGENKK